MDNKLLLVKCVTLLYRQSLLATKGDDSVDLVRTAIESIKLPDIAVGINSDREILKDLRTTTLEMCENGPDHEYEKTELLQRLKMNTHSDSSLYDILVQGIEPEMSEASLKRTIVNIRKSLHNHFRDFKVGETLQKAFNSFHFHREKIKSVPTFISELCAQLEPFQITSGTKDAAVVSEIDIGDETQTAQVFENIKNQETGASLIKTGWQELNKMLQGGFRRGEEWMLGALQHNNKTGFSLSLFLQFALYNKPMMIDEKKKPLLLRISFEDDITTNMNFVYKYLKTLDKLKAAHEAGKQDIAQSFDEEMEGLEEIVIGETTQAEIAAYVKEKLTVNGYEVKFMRVNPSEWTYMHICNKITELEAEGYEIHACMLDYLAMVPTTGCTVGPAGTDLRDMYRRTRNFCSPRGILLFTPHQLSTDAKQLIRDQRTDFLGEVANKGYLAGCKQLDQEIDGEMYIHIFKHKKRYYLGVQRGKHRGVPVLDDELKQFYLPFPKKGPIICDIWRNNVACRKLGGAPIGSGGEETPFWDFGKEEI